MNLSKFCILFRLFLNQVAEPPLLALNFEQFKYDFHPPDAAYSGYNTIVLTEVVYKILSFEGKHQKMVSFLNKISVIKRKTVSLEQTDVPPSTTIK